jgi:N-acetylglucosamine-6-phosphate deacetylase
LVTDAMQAAGMPDGIYRVGTASVEVRDGRALIAESGSIAGSTLTMDAAVRNAVRWLGVSVAEASVMASVNPARLLGVADRKGALVAGMDADLVILDDDLCACATMVEGRWVSEAPV